MQRLRKHTHAVGKHDERPGCLAPPVPRSRVPLHVYRYSVRDGNQLSSLLLERYPYRSRHEPDTGIPRGIHATPTPDPPENTHRPPHARNVASAGRDTSGGPDQSPKHDRGESPMRASHRNVAPEGPLPGARGSDRVVHGMSAPPPWPDGRGAGTLPEPSRGRRRVEVCSGTAIMPRCRVGPRGAARAHAA